MLHTQINRRHGTYNGTLSTMKLQLMSMSLWYKVFVVNALACLLYLNLTHPHHQFDSFHPMDPYGRHLSTTGDVHRALRTFDRKLRYTYLQPSTEASPNIPIFYNLYVGAESDAPRVQALVAEQMQIRRPEHYPVFVQSIGEVTPIPNATLLGHYKEATEMVTLKSLWEYCQRHPLDKVVYLHSKGSFSDTPGNERLRRFLTFGALSKECSNLPNTCNVCSSRFSPLPHPHTSGNMWLARCDYVQHLIDPSVFENKMEAFRTTEDTGEQSCDGRLRYAAEHWIHSHPDVKPCDLYTNPKFTWGYNNLPYTKGFHIQLAVAPRFDLRTYVHWPECAGRGMDLDQRVAEYRGLYQKRPGKDWFGWKFYQTANDTENPLPYYLLYWQWLTPNLRKETEKLGYTEESWDNLKHPTSLEGKNWKKLWYGAQEGLSKLGYKPDVWDERLAATAAGQKAGVTSPSVAKCSIEERIEQGPTIDKYPKPKDTKKSKTKTTTSSTSINPFKDYDQKNFGTPVVRRSGEGTKKRVLVIASVPIDKRHVVALWSQLECFTADVDVVVLTAPKWSKKIIAKIVAMAKKNIPRFANGEVKLEVKRFLHNRYDVGLWCDALHSINVDDFDEFGIINDSVFAIREHGGVFDALSSKNASLTSLSYSNTAKWFKGFGPEHYWVESVYRGFNKDGIVTFQDHSCVPEDHPFFCPTEDDRKACIINNFEHDLAAQYPCNKVYGLYPSDSPAEHLVKNGFPTWVKNADYWRELVERAGFPIAKVKEDEMIKDLTNAQLDQCTQHFNFSLVEPGGIGFHLARPYHQWPWAKLNQKHQHVAQSVLKLDKSNWRDWSTMQIASQSFDELTQEEQFCISQVLECSATAWNRNECGPQAKERTKKAEKKGGKKKGTATKAKLQKKKLIPRISGHRSKQLVQERYRMHP